jgi:heterodisulfide reductase subunit B
MAEKKKYTPFFGCMITTKYPQFEASVRKTLPHIGVELVDLDGFSCCPDPIYFKGFDKEEWITLAARNICVAEEAGLDIVTCCSGCTATLKEANHLLKEDEQIRGRVNKRLKKIGREFKGTIEARHIVTVLRDDVGYDKIAASVKKPLTGLKVAIHYGCHLLKPSHIMQVDDPDRPTILEDLMKQIDVEPIEHEEKVLCCGKACMDEVIPQDMTRDILKSIVKLDVDCMGLICPTCFDEYDVGQLLINRKYKENFNLPVIYYFQLLGLAQGMEPKEMGLQRHKIKTNALLEKLALTKVS